MVVNHVFNRLVSVACFTAEQMLSIYSLGVFPSCAVGGHTLARTVTRYRLTPRVLASLLVESNYMDCARIKYLLMTLYTSSSVRSGAPLIGN